MLAALLAVTCSFTLLLAGCSDNADIDPQTTDGTDAAQTQQPSDTSPQDGTDSQSGTDSQGSVQAQGLTAFDMISQRMTESGRTYEAAEEVPAEDEYGKVSSRAISLEGDDLIVITEFETASDAQDYSGYFDETGSVFTDGSNVKVIDYVAPVHLWQHDNYIIEYCSETGEDLQLLNGIFGEEFAGAGSDYYYPTYATQVFAAVDNVGMSYTCARAANTAQTYMYEPDSICCVSVSNGETIWLSYYADEARAIDHVSRFSPDGKSYSGIGGNENTTMELGREYPFEIYRSGGLVVEYETKTGELSGALATFMGKKAVPYEAAGPVELEYNAVAVRTDSSVEGMSYPQYDIIRSHSELDAYTGTDGVYYDLGANAAWLDAVDAHDAEWFKKNDLILITANTVGEQVPAVMSVTKNTDGSYAIVLAGEMAESDADDSSQWHLLVSVSDGKLYPLSNVDIII